MVSSPLRGCLKCTRGYFVCWRLNTGWYTDLSALFCSLNRSTSLFIWAALCATSASPYCKFRCEGLSTLTCSGTICITPPAGRFDVT
ncbi:hypothetical protein BDW69DRAFT_154823 [Aspergillus filifer]